jgi:hypothetical protein
VAAPREIMTLTLGAQRATEAGLLILALLALHGCICPPVRDPDCDKPHSVGDPGKPYTDCRTKGNDPEFPPCAPRR